MLLRVGPTGVELRAAFAFAVEAHAHFALGREAWLLADAVDQPARRATAIQHGGWALDHLDTLDVGQVTEVQGIVAHAVDVHVANGAEAADGHLVALAVAVGQADAGHVLQHVLHGLRALILDYAFGHDVDGLRDITQRRVDLHGAAAFTGLVALLLVGAGDGSGGQGEATLRLGLNGSVNSRHNQQAQHGNGCWGNRPFCHYR